MDYTFLHIGGLYQQAVEITKALFGRFGDKADSVLLEAIDHIQNHKGVNGLAVAVMYESGVALTIEDVEFLKNIVDALGSINYARKLLDDAMKIAN